MPVSETPDPPRAADIADAVREPPDPEQPLDLPVGPGSREPGPTALPTELEAVVGRWNPQGIALLRAAGGSGAARLVTLIGPAATDTTLLRTELARFEPRVELSEPVPDAGASVQTTGGAPSVQTTGGAPPVQTLGGAPPVQTLGGAPPVVALILLDAGTTIGADSLGVIVRLRAEGTRILLAMNGIHAYQDWRVVRARDLELLAAEGAGDLDILPVSARLAVAARGTGDAGLLDRSGLGALHARLIAVASVDDTTGAQRLTAVTVRVLAETRQRVVEQVVALRSGAATARLREERAVLLAGRDGGRATAMSALRGQLHLARVDLMTDIGGQVRALHAAARGELDRLRRTELGGYPDRLQQAVTELTGKVDRAIDERLAELCSRVDGAAGHLPPGRRDRAPRVGPDPEPRHRGVEDHLMIALGASAGVGLGRLLVAPLSLLPALDVASVPVTLLLGGGAAAWVVRARAQLADRAHIRQWVADALVNVKAQLEQRAATALVETETVLADRVVQASAARMVDIDRRVAELEARLRRMAAEQPGQLAACERDIRHIDHWNPPVEPHNQVGTQ